MRVRVCVCVCVCACIFVCVYACVRMRACVCLCMRACACVCMWCEYREGYTFSGPLYVIYQHRGVDLWIDVLSVVWSYVRFFNCSSEYRLNVLWLLSVCPTWGLLWSKKSPPCVLNEVCTLWTDDDFHYASQFIQTNFDNLDLNLHQRQSSKSCFFSLDKLRRKSYYDHQDVTFRLTGCSVVRLLSF